MSRIKVCVDVVLKSIPRNCIFIDTPEQLSKKEQEDYAIEQVKRILCDPIKSRKAIKTKDGYDKIPEDLIDHIDIYTT